MEKRLNETNRMRKLMDLPLITERVRDSKTDADVEYLSALKAAIKGPGTNEEKVYEVLGKLNKLPEGVIPNRALYKSPVEKLFWYMFTPKSLIA